MASPSGPQLPQSVVDLLERIQSDPVTRVRLLSRFSDTLIDLGVNPDDVKFVSGIDVVKASEEFPGRERDAEPETEEGEEVGIVFISRRDRFRNTESIIVG